VDYQIGFAAQGQIGELLLPILTQLRGIPFVSLIDLNSTKILMLHTVAELLIHRFHADIPQFQYCVSSLHLQVKPTALPQVLVVAVLKAFLDSTQCQLPQRMPIGRFQAGQ
jgi:hypothetical protein